VDTFAVVSGDSDFSPLVSKLRENAKTVIGVGVKESTSDLLIGNCDEFIYYDDLVRKEERQRRRSSSRKKSTKKTAPAAPKEATKEEAVREEEKVQEALDLVLETISALREERGEEETIWGSMVKQTLKRRRPGFDESYYGFRSFGKLLEEAQSRSLLELEAEEKSGGYIVGRVLTDE
jgi:hypothetical protein